MMTLDTTQIEDIYPLTPTQRGMLFHTLYAPRSAVYFQQEGFLVEGEFNRAAFVRAWEHVLARHPVLRTAIVWEGLDEPVQVVFRRIRLPLEEHDWRDVPSAEHAARLDELAQAERDRGFDPVEAPLMRLTLIRLADDTHHVIWSRHHLLLDGWSVALILTEVLRSYAALRHGRQPNLERPLPYRNYLAWLQRQNSAQAEAFWRKELAGFKQATPLGVDRPPSQPPGHEQYAEAWAHISPEITAALQSLARAQRITVNTLFQGAWALMLSRYSGEEEILFGATGSGRPTAIPGVESMAGLLINTLPVRVRVSPSQPLIPWLQRILAQQGESRHYDYSSLVDIQRWSDIPRGQPLFDSLLVFENFPRAFDEEARASNLAFSSAHSFECTNYPLNLAVLPGDGLALRAIYDLDRFDRATIERMLGHLQTLLAGMLADPSSCIGDLPLLSEAERRDLLHLGAGTRRVGDEAAAIQQRFELQAEHAPQAIALSFEQRRLTYHELNQRSNQLAHYLRARGVKPDLRVGICMERSLDLVVGLLGILKAGAAYFALDPADPIARIVEMLDRAEVPLLLTQARLIRDIPEFGARQSAIVRIDDDWSTISREPGENPAPAASGENLAAVLVTSKGAAQIEHRALWNRLEHLQQTFDLAPSDVVLHKAALASETATWEIFWPLLAGARVAIALPEGQDDPDYLRQVIAEQSISIVHLSRSAVLAARQSLAGLASLRAVLYSGEPLSGTLAPSGVDLYRLYSPPEAGTCVIKRHPRSEAGKDLRDEQLLAPGVYVLDAALRLLPLGVAGDLYLAGPRLARGYLADSAATAGAFIPDPFSTTPGDRLFKSGDRGRRLSDGSIELVRSDARQVWIEGRRIDVGEVEAALLHEPLVQDCAVLARETAEGARVLVAYITSGKTLLAEQIQARLRTRLPEALCPAAYIPVTRLPLTETGQVDERALAQIELIDAELAQRWETEARTLAEIEQVAVVVQQPVERPPALHLNDLVPGWKQAADRPEAATSEAAATDLAEIQGKPALADGGPLLIPDDAPTTLAQALIQTAARHPENGIVYVQTDGATATQTYPALLGEAGRVLAGLHARGFKPGDRAILHIEQLSDYLPVFWGCILGGITPVTVVVAPAYVENNSVVNKLYNIWDMLGHPPVLASAQLIEPLRSLSAFLPTRDMQILAIGELRQPDPATAIHHAAPHEVAFLQLTSGSTGVPKCIQETHQGVISYVHASRQVNTLTADDVALNWLPIDHVGALIMFHIRDLYIGCHQIQARTDMILAEPLTWLDLIERYKVTHTWSPNFGYKLVADRLAEEPGRNWDLSSVREFLNGGEQVTLTVVRAFLDQVAGFKVAPHAMQPAYGMAETCTAMTHVRHFDFTDSVGYFDKQSLRGQLRRVPPEYESAVLFVEVGPPNPGVQIRIVDPASRVLPEGVIGRLQVKGAIVTPGYLDNPAANQESFTDDGWFYTGDLSMILDGRLMITGREKEVIIINGANYYCYEIEDAVKQISGVEGTSVGVCEVDDPRSGTEGIAVCFTPTVAALEEQLAVIDAIRARVVAAFGLNPAAIVPIPKDQFPKTTSGKIQRTQLKAALASGQFDAILKAIDIRLENSNTLPDWFYRKVWQPRQGRATKPRTALRRSLVFLDSPGLGRAARAELDKAGHASIGVEPGVHFAQLSRHLYRIDPRNPEHYRLLLESLAHDQPQIDHILHLWSYAPWSGEPASSAAIEQALDEGVYSLLFLIQALNAAQDRAPLVQLDVVSSYVQAVTPGDLLACERAAITGVIKTIPHELPWLNARHIDLPLADVAANAACLLREIHAAQKEREIAYRDGRRLVAGLEPAPRPQESAPDLPFKPGGMYVMSGGLGGIGALIAAYLCQRYHARLLIIGRTPLPEGASQHGADRPADLVKTWRALQQSGGDVLYEAGDICNAERLRAAVERAQEHWQCELDGVLHLAGVYHDQLLTEATRDSFSDLLRPKLLGAWALHQLVKDRPGSLFISFSSVHSFFGGFNVGAYAAANSFLDAFAHYQRETGAVNSFSFAWSMWEKLGISRSLEVQDQLEARGYATLSPQQGLYSLLAGLRLNQPYLAIGLDRTKQPIAQALVTGPHRAQVLRAYFTGSSAVPLEQLQDLVVHDRFQTRSSCDFVQLKALPQTAEGKIDRLALAELDGTHAPRKASYVAPQTEFERTIAAIWQSALRIEKVGIHDNFFDLGGQSLLMTQVQGKLRAALNRDISMVDMFKYPTISSLAKYLSQEQDTPVVSAAPADRTAKQKEAIARRKQQAAQRRKDGE